MPESYDLRLAGVRPESGVALRTEKEKMLAGELYQPGDAQLQADMAVTRQWLVRYNASLSQSPAARRSILKERLGSVGEGAVIRPPFFCDYGFNIMIGTNAFMNYNCVILDITAVVIGDGAQIGPAVQIYGADHPRDAEQRKRGLEFGRNVTIGANAWIGGGAIILPGVTVGADAVVGAGSVVTRDVAPRSVVFGNPARSR